MPVNRWFENDNERDAYDERLSMMEILPPKYIGEGVLPEGKYPEFWRLIDIQGLRPFLFMSEGFWFGFRLGGRTYQFPLSVLATAWGLENKGATFKGGSIPHRLWGEFDKLEATTELRLEMSASGKYVISRMSTDHRLLLYVAGIDMSREEAETPGKANVITTKNINLMRRNTVNQANEAGYAGKDTVAEDVHMVDVQPQVEVGPSSQVPTEVEVPPPVQQVIKEFIQIGFEGMRNMVTEGFARLSNRLDNLDTRMASLQDEFRRFRDKDPSADNSKQQDGATARDQSS
ncbi:hypothetical protein PIB30_057016 [Stylosanthes scabra]|uniref:Uncharacterized protein n=1 Tax=Stylosanthes scabra TaxID=79078 RepID=A0ABU6ZI75_9FABA|nr:hypothetical protein [Stylosanthes scabra]